MTQIKGDLVNRVKRLPKPTSAAEALQPLFEAVSNSIHAIDDRFGVKANESGEIKISITGLRKPEKLEITVADNGIGLDSQRFEAFCTTDTSFKIARGGKGIGRLLWLDAFEKVSVNSIYVADGE
jgi:anti-sigma regulatory factor (Ser/Thr protein kinase)